MDEDTIEELRNQIKGTQEILTQALAVLDVDMVHSEVIGKMIAPDFDDTDLTNLSASIDAAISELTELNETINSITMD